MTSADETDDGDGQPIGHVLDGLGIRASLADGELVESAMVLLKIVQADGDTRLTLASSDGLGWIERCGMLRVAELIESDVTSDRA